MIPDQRDVVKAAAKQSAAFPISETFDGAAPPAPWRLGSSASGGRVPVVFEDLS